MCENVFQSFSTFCLVLFFRFLTQKSEESREKLLVFLYLEKRWGNCILGEELRDNHKSDEIYVLCGDYGQSTFYSHSYLTWPALGPSSHRLQLAFLFLWRLHGKSFFGGTEGRENLSSAIRPVDRREPTTHSKEEGKKLEQNFSASGLMSVDRGSRGKEKNKHRRS